MVAGHLEVSASVIDGYVRGVVPVLDAVRVDAGHARGVERALVPVLVRAQWDGVLHHDLRNGQGLIINRKQ